MTALDGRPRTARLLDAPVLPRPRGVDVIAVADRAGLVGRGGGGFPTARKLAAVRGRHPVLIANGSEGEPLSAKDAALLARSPHLVLDGIVLAAQAIGAREAHLCVHADSPGLPAALARHDLGGVTVHLRPVPRRYVAGEESALARWVAGGPALPTTRPPLLVERGTLVLNTETLAGLALAVHAGPDAHRATGDPAEPGTLLLTVTGAVPRPGVLEVPTGTLVGDALTLAGLPPAADRPAGFPSGVGGLAGFPPGVGRPAGAGRAGAVLTGGFGGAWLPGDVAAGVPLTQAGMRAAGGALGPGILAVLPPYACGLAETVRIARWLAAQSAGQCGPCVFGLPDVAGALAAAAEGGPHAPAALDAVRRWTATLPGRGACRHPDGAARLVTSALRVFEADLVRHVGGRPCPGWYAPPVLEVPA